MAVVKEGIKVSILFEAKLETGEIVLKTEEEHPLEVTVGEGIIPKSIEKALIDMKAGETKTMTLEPTEAFGPRLEDLVIDLPKDGFGPDCDLEVGSKVSMNSSDGKKFTGTVTEIKDENITVDFNHPLAGKNLVFTVTVVSVE
jgi:peptidylprolyl isomerase